MDGSCRPSGDTPLGKLPAAGRGTQMANRVPVSLLLRLGLYPPKDVIFLLSNTCGCDCIWNSRSLQTINKMRWFDWALIQYDWRLYKKEKFGSGSVHTERTSCRDEGKDQGDISTVKASKAPRSCERGPGMGSPSEPQKESTLLTSSSWISRLQNCEAINVCCVSTSDWWYLVMVTLTKLDIRSRKYIPHQKSLSINCKNPCPK